MQELVSATPDDGLNRLRRDHNDCSTALCCNRDTGDSCGQRCLQQLHERDPDALKRLALIASRVCSEIQRLRKQGHADENVHRGSSAYRLTSKRRGTGTILAGRSKTSTGGGEGPCMPCSHPYFYVFLIISAPSLISYDDVTSYRRSCPHTCKQEVL